MVFMWKTSFHEGQNQSALGIQLKQSLPGPLAQLPLVPIISVNRGARFFTPLLPDRLRTQETGRP